MQRMTRSFIKNLKECKERRILLYCKERKITRECFVLLKRTDAQPCIFAELCEGEESCKITVKKTVSQFCFTDTPIDIDSGK